MGTLVAQALRETSLFEQKKTICDWARPKQMPQTDQITGIALLKCAPISEIPSNISTMN